MSKSGLELAEKLKEKFMELSMHDLENIRSLASDTIKERFVRPKKCKRGKLSPYITKHKWEKILRAEKNIKFRFCYYLMRKLALRVGEVVELNIKNINLELKEIFIITEKSQMPDKCFLDQESTQKLKEWIKDHEAEILINKGFIFCPCALSNSIRTHISKDTIRNHFREAVKKAGVQTAYGHAFNQNRVLNLLTTHSCRHSGITDFYLKTKDLVLTQKYARHQDIKSTMVYIHHTEEDMRNALENPLIEIPNDDRIILLQIIEEFKKNRIKSVLVN